MRNRIIAFVTLGSFLVFCWSCYSIREIKPEVLATAKPDDYEIRKIEKTTGETVEYSDKASGREGQGQIMGTGKLTYSVKTVEVDSAGLEIISKPGAPFIEVKTQDGHAYGWIKKIDERGNKSVLHILKAGGQESIATPTLFIMCLSKSYIRNRQRSGDQIRPLSPRADPELLTIPLRSYIYNIFYILPSLEAFL